MQHYIRKNYEAIIDFFMKKYIFNALELEISKDEESHDDQNNLNGITGCQSDATGSSSRS